MAKRKKAVTSAVIADSVKAIGPKATDDMSVQVGNVKVALLKDGTLLVEGVSADTIKFSGLLVAWNKFVEGPKAR